jgi:hypothetical protein
VAVVLTVLIGRVISKLPSHSARRVLVPTRIAVFVASQIRTRFDGCASSERQRAARSYGNPGAVEMHVFPFLQR